MQLWRREATAHVGFPRANERSIEDCCRSGVRGLGNPVAEGHRQRTRSTRVGVERWGRIIQGICGVAIAAIGIYTLINEMQR